MKQVLKVNTRKLSLQPAGSQCMSLGLCLNLFPAALRPVSSEDEGELQRELGCGLEEALEGLEVDGRAHVAGVKQAERG